MFVISVCTLMKLLRSIEVFIHVKQQTEGAWLIVTGLYLLVCYYIKDKMKNDKDLLDIGRCGMSANETTLHPSHNFKKLTIIGQCTAFNTEPWLTPNNKL